MVKKMTSYSIVLILIILLAISTSITILSQTILKEEFIEGLLNKNNYYSKIYNEIIEIFKNNTIQSGLEENVLDGIITEEKVENDVKLLIKNIYGKEETSINIEMVKAKLEENINQKIKENNKKVNQEEQKNIDAYVKTITDIYSNGIIYAKQYIPKIQNIISNIQKNLVKIEVITYAVSILLIIILFIMNKEESLNYLSIASISTGMLLIMPKILVSLSLKIENILLFNKAFSNVVIDGIENIMLRFLILRNYIFISRGISKCNE